MKAPQFPNPFSMELGYVIIRVSRDIPEHCDAYIQVLGPDGWEYDIEDAHKFRRRTDAEIVVGYLPESPHHTPPEICSVRRSFKELRIKRNPC